jgi:hypothetical protein
VLYENLTAASPGLSKAPSQITIPHCPTLFPFHRDPEEEFIHPLMNLLMDLHCENAFVPGTDLHTFSAEFPKTRWRATIDDIQDVLFKTGDAIVLCTVLSFKHNPDYHRIILGRWARMAN